MSKIRNELRAIQAADPGGILHPEKAVAWAKSHKSSALYRALEWNDNKAAAEYRLSQIRRLIQIYVVTGDGRPQLVSLTIDRSNGGGYRPIEKVVADPDLAAELLKDALHELERVREHYEWIKSLQPIWNEVDKVKTRAARRSKRSGDEPRASA